MTDTKPCARCGKQNPAEIHTCTPPALRLAEQLEDTEGARLHLLPYAATELRRLHAENEALRDQRYELLAALRHIEGPAQGESVVG